MQNISQLDQKDLDLLFDQDPDDVDLDYCYSKLQQTEFRKFGGDIRDWLSFWSQLEEFTKIRRFLIKRTFDTSNDS